VYRRSLCLLALIMTTDPARADSWEWSLTPYLWAAGIDGVLSTGPVKADFSADFGDIVNVLEGAIILGAEARSGQNFLFADIVSLALDKDDAKTTAGGMLAADVDALILEGGYGRAMSEGFVIEGGLRYLDFDTRLDPAVAASVERSSDLLDVFAGVRVESSIGQKWSFRLRGNVGTGDSDLALEVTAAFLRGFSNGNALSIGARGLDIDSSKGGDRPLELDVRFAGLTIGYTFNW
jgi:hypothetical protein